MTEIVIKTPIEYSPRYIQTTEIIWAKNPLRAVVVNGIEKYTHYEFEDRKEWDQIQIKLIDEVDIEDFEAWRNPDHCYNIAKYDLIVTTLEGKVWKLIRAFPIQYDTDKEIKNAIFVFDDAQELINEREDVGSYSI